MPNGGAPDRVFVLMNVYFAKYGRWPARLRVPSSYLRGFESWRVGDHTAAELLRSKLDLVAEDRDVPTLLAEGGEGQEMTYAEALEHTGRISKSSWEWVGIDPTGT